MQALGGGLLPGALHEIHAGDWAAAGFAACLAIRMAGNKPLFWVRPDYEALEYGAISPKGLLELGGDPARSVSAGGPQCHRSSGRRRRHSGLRPCRRPGAGTFRQSRKPGSGGQPAAGLRRRARAASPCCLLREGAVAMPSAALTRWQVTSAPSSAGDDWGAPAFTAALVRNRLGPTGCWTMQWDPEHGLFRETRHDQYAPHPGRVAAAFSDRPDLSRQARASAFEEPRL